MCSTVVDYVIFTVMHSCAPNSNVCTGLQSTHDNVVSEIDQCMSGVVALQSVLSCTFINYTKNVSDSRAVV